MGHLEGEGKKGILCGMGGSLAGALQAYLVYADTRFRLLQPSSLVLNPEDLLQQSK